MGKNRTHYTKELADIIREKINNTDAIPEASFGEITINDLAEELGRDREKIQKIADSYKKSNPEYFVLKRKKFIWKGVERQQTSLHYTKELADIIREKIIQEETDTPGASFDEITNNALAKETGNSPQYIKKIAEEYKLSNPEYFTFRKGKNEKIALHYTKELADIIRQKGKNIAEAPQDWESTEGIAERLGISKEEVEKMAKKIRQEHQGEFGKFKDRNEG
jgi:DNA-binding IscR family transcriptional regulator